MTEAKKPTPDAIAYTFKRHLDYRDLYLLTGLITGVKGEMELTDALMVVLVSNTDESELADGPLMGHLGIRT